MEFYFLLLNLLFITSLESSPVIKNLKSLKIAAFNIQVFGSAKMAKPEVADIIVKIILRYDLVLIQEIRDKKNDSILSLLNIVNSRANNTKYDIALSDRVGRTSSKEQFAFLYRKDQFTVKSAYKFNDGGDVFEREPYIIRVTAKSAKVADFALVGTHVQPSTAVKEINALVDVYKDVKKKWKVNDVILLGDFNAGCSYVPKYAWKTIELWTDTTYQWLIDHDANTSVNVKKCPYDRIVIAGNKMKHSTVPASGTVFYFDVEYHLTLDEALAVSDHYPVEMQIYV